MNYRHGYHAGNFADVLKHLALCELLRLLTAKDKKLFVLDTHAGAGSYDLAASLASRTREAESGIVRLMAMARCGAIRDRRGWCAGRCGRATGSSPASSIRRRRWR